MILLQANNIEKNFGSECILSNIKLEVKTRDRIALVGRNGAGKSTLLKILSRQMSFDSGEIIQPKGVSLGYLEQHSGLNSERTIWNEMMTLFEDILQMEQEMRKIELRMGEEEVYSNPALYDKYAAEYDQLREDFQQKNGYAIESEIRSVLHGLGFPVDTHQLNISSLSGGQRTRLALGKLLLTKPDLLILDEPTNHLDIETLSWLENFLQSYPGAILIVSHDRYFLDAVVNIVYELSRHQIRKYHGNYTKYTELKEAEYERDLKLFEKQQNEIEKLQDFVQRNIARASTTRRAQSRQKQLNRMEKLDRPAGDAASASFQFTIAKQSGNQVLTLKDIQMGYGGQPIVPYPLSASIHRGESIALVGHNGVGKSTLLKTIVNKLPLLAGDILLGANVQVSYYDQQQADLRSHKTVLQELWDDYPTVPEKEIRTILGNFLFRGDDVMKPVSLLSGGEKARLTLAKLMMEKGNLLILDEPTNHLDLDSKEVLENALMDYPGTILFVSHDRYFINRIATKVIELTDTDYTTYLGDYDYYLEKKAEMEEIYRLENPEIVAIETKSEGKKSFEADKETKKLQRQRQRKIEELEEHILSLEEQIAELEEQLCLPEVFQDYEKVSSLQAKLEQHKTTLEEKMEEWEQLQD